MSVRKPFRIIMHWTAGGSTPSNLDKDHYHSITAGDGSQVMGFLKPESNNDTSDGQYAAHTRAANTGAIGMALAAMFEAKERPFDSGPYPINRIQLDAFAQHVAEMAETYGIPVSRDRILTHAEVQRTLGIAQRGKWDITWLPGMKAPRDAIEVGDGLRQMVAEELARIQRPRRPRCRLLRMVS